MMASWNTSTNVSLTVLVKSVVSCIHCILTKWRHTILGLTKKKEKKEEEMLQTNRFLESKISKTRSD